MGSTQAVHSAAIAWVKLSSFLHCSDADAHEQPSPRSTELAQSMFSQESSCSSCFPGFVGYSNRSRAILQSHQQTQNKLIVFSLTKILCMSLSMRAPCFEDFSPFILRASTFILWKFHHTGVWLKHSHAQAAPRPCRADHTSNIHHRSSQGSMAKKATSAYWLWLGENRVSITQAHGLKRGSEVAKKAGELWKSLGPADKKKYEDLAAKDKIRYEEEVKTLGSARLSGRRMTKMERSARRIKRRRRNRCRPISCGRKVSACPS